MQGITITLEELLALRYTAQELHLPEKVTHFAQNGDHPSPFRGRGMDFIETRVYQPGDDVRNINWAVTARTGKPHTKIYQQERERPVYLIIDFNASMFFGTRIAYKSVIAAQAAATLAWSALKRGDRIGALLLKNDFKIITPCQRRQQLIEFFKCLITYVEPTWQVAIDYTAAFKRFKNTLKAGSVIYYFSDFYCLNDSLEQELSHLAKHHELSNIFIYDCLEKHPPRQGYYLFHDQMNAGGLLVDTHCSDFRNKYQEIFEHRVKRLKRLAFRARIPLLELRTDDDIAKALRPLLGRRQ
jgi:uncharacterized protein (DUF58 family)